MQLQMMDDRVSITKNWYPNYKFHLIKGLGQLEKLADICLQRKLCSLDLETDGLDTRVYSDSHYGDGKNTKYGIRTVSRIVGVCMSFDGLNGYYIPLSHEPEDSNNLPWEESWEILTRIVNGCRVIFHNSKFDCELLYPVTGKDFWKKDEYEDTLLLAKVISPLKGTPAGLKPLTRLYFNVDMIELEELFTNERREFLKREKKGLNFGLLHPNEGLEYGCSDGIFTYKLFPALKEKLTDGDQKIYDLEKSFCNVIRELERNRVHLDIDRVRKLLAECDVALNEVGDMIRNVIESKTGNTGKWLTLNIGSPKQLSAVFLTDPEGLKLKPTQKMLESENEFGSDDDDDDDSDPTDKQYSLKDEAVKSMHETYGSRFLVKRTVNEAIKNESIFELTLEWRHYQKMKGSYLEPLTKSVDKYGDVRPDFNPMGTDTARLSSRAGKIQDGYSGINFQGIPRDSDEDKPELFKQIRSCIAPRLGWILVKIDYAGEELRVVTNLSGDPVWTKSFLYEDGDVHSITARTLFGKQTVNKDERNRGKRCNFAFIYGGGAGAIQRNVGCSIEDAGRHMEHLKQDVPVLMGYVEHQKQFARKYKCIFTAFGRKLPIPTIDSPIRALRSKAERCAINYTIQSTSADVLKFAMCYVDKNIRQLGWKDRVRYVLTVHDEVVYEVKPEHLMEVVRKLDEWMTYPWKVAKAHGKQWVVPLVTEPGIGSDWRTPYDFFKMVDGVKILPKDIGSNGDYKGKLKKDEYVHNSKIYQKIPDILAQYIKRLEESVSDVQKPVEPEEPKGEPGEPVADTGPVQIPESVVKPQEIPEGGFSDISLDTPLDLGPEDIDGNPTKISEPDKVNTSDVSPQPAEDKPVQIYRWTMRAPLNEFNMRKLQAACTIAQGEVLLRILNLKGEILVEESVNVRIDPIMFNATAKLLGLG